MANATVARPVIRSDLGQIWFPDIAKGFHVVQFREGVWPFAGQDPCPHEDYYLAQYDLGYADCRAQRAKKAIQLPSTRTCRSRRDFTIRLRRPARGRIRASASYVDGKRRHLAARLARADADRPARAAAAPLHDQGRRDDHARPRRFTEQRRYRTCVPKARRSGAAASRLTGIDTPLSLASDLRVSLVASARSGSSALVASSSPARIR